MKVTISNDSKKMLTMDDISTARQIIKDFKDDECTVAEYAEMAAKAIVSVQDSCGYCVKVLESAAFIAKNCRVWDALSDGSHDLDVWIDAIVMTSNDFYIIGVYITDLWELSSDNKSDIVSRMFIRHFSEK